MNSSIINTNEQLQYDEETLTKYLAECTIETIQYHAIVYEMPLYIPFEPPFDIPGYEPTTQERDGRVGHMYITKPKNPKRANKIAPFTFFQLYFYKNKRTGNTVEVSLSSKSMRDKDEIPYSTLRVKFRGENENVKFSDIALFLGPMMTFNLSFIEKAEETNRISKVASSKLFKKLPFYPFYIEPCVDIRGPKESIEYIHNCFMNLYMSGYSNFDPFKGKSSGKTIKFRDGRTVNSDYPTIYISDRARAYRYSVGKNHYIRFEFMFDKDFLGKREVQTVDDLLPQRDAQAIWNKRCFFFALDIPKIKNSLYSKCPELVDDIINSILERKVNDKGKTYTDWDRLVALRKYKIGNKKLFRTVRDFTVPRWLTLHKFISDGLGQLSLTQTPQKGFNATPVPAKLLSKRRKISKTEIEQALLEMAYDGIDITWPNLMKKLGTKTKSHLSRHAGLIREYKATVLIDSRSTQREPNT